MRQCVRLNFNPFVILGLSLDASEEQIRKAYKTLSLRHHPDRGGDEELMKKINVSYDVLKNENARNQ